MVSIGIVDSIYFSFSRNASFMKIKRQRCRVAGMGGKTLFCFDFPLAYWHGFFQMTGNDLEIYELEYIICNKILRNSKMSRNTVCLYITYIHILMPWFQYYTQVSDPQLVTHDVDCSLEWPYTLPFKRYFLCCAADINRRLSSEELKVLPSSFGICSCVGKSGLHNSSLETMKVSYKLCWILIPFAITTPSAYNHCYMAL